MEACMDTTKTVQRRQLVVDPDLQYGLIVKFVIFMTIILILSLVLLTFIFSKFTNIALPVSVETGGVTSFEAIELIRLSDMVWPLLFVILLSVFLAGITFYFFGIFLTHKMAGPVHRLRKDIAAMAEGNLARMITFRENDYFQFLAEDFEGLRKLWLASAKELKAVSRKLDDAPEKERKELLNRFDSILADLLKTVS